MKNQLKPLITIITVCYNAALTLEQTIRSVIYQTYDNIEYIIIDGGSDDGTQGIISKYDDNIAYWISEPDDGIYDAMNKGLSAGNGDYYYFLGADDVLIDSCIIERIITENSFNNCFDVIYGKVVYDNNKMFISSLGLKSLVLNTLHHQSALYSKSFFNNFKYDQKYKVIADYELTLRVFTGKYSCLKIDELIAMCSSGGISSTSNDIVNYIDAYKIRASYVNNVINIILLIIGVANSVYKNKMQCKCINIKTIL